MDCSTFAFDLHVLGTPPALILSQDQTLMLNSSPFDSPACAGSLRDNCLTRGRFIGSCVVQSVLIESGSSPVAFARTDNSGRPIDAMPPADSHCLSLPAVHRRLRAAARRQRLTGCVYLHAYLVFKEPTAARQWRPARHSARSHRPGLAWKASPPVGRGTFRGTLRGYRHRFALSTQKMRRRKKRARLDELGGRPS